MQQFYVEEVSRSSGDSGLKQSRLTHSGTRSYHTTSFSGNITLYSGYSVHYLMSGEINIIS